MIARCHLIDTLPEAKITAPGPDHVAVHPVTIKRQKRMSIFQHPDSSITYDNLELGKNSHLKFAMGLKEVIWSKVSAAVEFAVTVIDCKNKVHKIFSQSVDCRKPSDQVFFEIEVDLKKFDRQKISLTFTTSIASGADGSYCWSAWADPVIESEKVTRPPVRRNDKHKNIILITSDALRADHLACYGHPVVKTPNIDKLAEEGILVAQARAHTTSTLASFVSIISGLNALEHGLTAEWGAPDKNLPNLPTYLRGHGYHSIAAFGAKEHDSEEDGMLRWFDERIPCLGTPVQSGDIATRRMIDWLDKRPDKPFFAWLQYFDTHPPMLQEAPFDTLYFNGDPTAKIHSYYPEKIKEIHAVESLLELKLFLKFYKQGKICQLFSFGLDDTARCLLGESNHGPDLVSYLNALGAPAMLNKGADEFAHWLMERSAALRRGEVECEFIEWIETLMPMLVTIESELISWLNDVVDYRFALAQYMGSVTFLDHQIGQLIEALKERNLYDQTTIVFTSPHGELLGEHGMFYHHFKTTEEVLRVPFIIKPHSSSGAKTGTIVDGTIEQYDIAATIAESVQLAKPPGMSGVSRWHDISKSASITEHDSFSISFQKTMATITRPPYVFLKALSNDVASTQWQWERGQIGLFKLQHPMSYDQNLVDAQFEIARDMEARLDRWLASAKVKAEAV